MLCLTKPSRLAMRWIVACVAASLWCWVGAADVPPLLKVRQQGDGVVLDAEANLHVPAEIEAVMRNGVPMVATQTLTLTQTRWYWRDAVLVDTRREWTIAYQALTGQWRVVERGTNKVENFPQLAQAWTRITDVSAWRFADVEQLGALQEAQVAVRWYIDRKPLSNLAPIASASTPALHIDVVATTQVPPLIAPVRDALPKR